MFKMVEASMGFVPSSMLTMAKAPGLGSAFARLAGRISSLGQIDRGLAQMNANMATMQCWRLSLQLTRQLICVTLAGRLVDTRRLERVVHGDGNEPLALD